jgi:hypothetical protein
VGWRLGADVVVLLHAAFIVFVVAGGLLALRWRWVALVHLPVAVYGVVIELVGFTCPLTPLEKALRRRAGSSGYDGGFVEHYVIPVVYPGEFTPGVKVVVALLIVVANVVVYGLLVRTRRRTTRRRSRAAGEDPQATSPHHGPGPG